mmetsp:Transcript_20710/g.48379  ORF Transcript_20710/g.48379 Transcript_20710/m.48379 type:complete len:566 (+) Transcript_20710:75-1772(+)
MALPEGIESDRRLEEARQAVSSLQDVSEKLGDKFQVPRAKNYLQSIAECVDPNQNPAGYRLCQEEVDRVGGPRILLHVFDKTDNDLLRSLIMEVCARLMFGNAEVSSKVLGEHGDGLLFCIRRALSEGAVPERLSALFLAQAMAAAEAGPDILAAVAAEAAPYLQAGHGFAQLSEAALDVLTSISFVNPGAVISHLGWSKMHELLQEGEAPPSTAAQELQVLVCGLLSANCLPIADGATAEELKGRLAHGSFFQFYAKCLECSTRREAWPQGSNTFHAPRRLARCARTLAAQGFRRQLLPATTLLPRAVEASSDGAVHEAIEALKELAADALCLEALLAEEGFRETLELLHRQEGVGTELLSYLELVENAMAAGQAAKNAQAHENPFAPSVIDLTEIFSRHAALDGKMDVSYLGWVCAAVPLCPVATVQRSLHSETALSLQSFLEHVYGTPTILGWWPSMMEEPAAMVASVATSVPDLGRLCAAYEAATDGRGTLQIQELHDVLLPSLEVSIDGPVIEAKFAELHGSQPLSFKEFVTWMTDLFDRLRQEFEAEAMQASQLAAGES